MICDVRPAEPATAEVRAAGIDPTPHLDFARIIGLTVAKRHKLRGQEAEEIVAVAYLELCRRATRFDPARLAWGDHGHLFRGYARPHLFCCCRRAADALRRGGLTGAADAGEAGWVEPLSGKTTPGGDPYEPVDGMGCRSDRLIPA